MLALIHDDTGNVLSIQHITPKIWKDGIIQTPPVVAIKRLKDPLTWLKKATTLEKPPIPTQGMCSGWAKTFEIYSFQSAATSPGGPMSLTHLPLMLYICISESGQYWFR